MILNKLKYYRLNKGYTQEDLSRKTKVTLRQIQKIEDGQNTTIKTALKIKKVLQVSLDELFPE
jgi:transcriptional regulator with XRE-family HTH domain